LPANLRQGGQASPRSLAKLVEKSGLARQAGPMMKKYNVAMTEEMERRLEAERKKRALDSIPETVRYILSEYLAKS
jgi:hypothetical protein